MEKEKKKKKGLALRIGLVVLGLALAGFFTLIGFITDYMWFKELGYVSVFLKQLITQLQIGLPTFVVLTILSYLYFKVLKRNYYKKIESRDLEKNKSVNLASWLMAGIFGGVVTYFAVTKLWFEALKFFNSSPFNLKDPIFNMDVSFYTFKLDFISKLNLLAMGILALFFIMTLVYYGILMGTRKPKIHEEQKSDNPFEEEEERFDGTQGYSDGPKTGQDMFGQFSGVFEKFEKAFKGNINRNVKKATSSTIDDDNVKRLLTIASTQITIVVTILFLMLGLNFFLKQFSLLYTQTGAVYGAGFTDVNVTLLMYRILMGLAVIGAVMTVVFVNRRKLKPVLFIPVLMIIVGLLGSGAGMLVQNFIVSPDEISKESKYLERNIKFTQYAYGLDKVKVKDFPANANLTKEDIKKNQETIKNIRINDYQPAEKFYNQTQSIRQYYTFKDADVDRYMINGEYTQTFLSAREIDESKISDTWLNKRLKYTHGYGITLSQVNKVTPSGQPDMLIHSIPPVSSAKEIKVTRPEIYFGELTNEYIIVGTDEDEFDYPDGSKNKYARYEGSAGIKLNLLNKVMFAIRERSMKLLVSSNISKDSKIIINRNIQKRIEKIMPYLGYDTDPYMVTANGKLYWVVDAYTTSNKFPYAEAYSKTTKTNYIRNSVKVVVDAYNGNTDFYIVDKNDPIAATYKNIYPKLFKNMEKMPEELKKHLRYPNNLFEIQAEVYKRYHMNDVKVFYQNEDLWDVSDEIYGTKQQKMTGNYYIMKIPGEKKAEFVNSIPYTPKDKKNMTGLLLARNDGAHYGEMVLFRLPKNKITYGPMQIEAQIDQSTEISKEFSLWNSSGSKYSRGNMFVVPVEDSLLYVEPVYLEATNSSIPEVKRVIVAYGDRIAYKPTLTEALDVLFGEGSGFEEKKSGQQQQESKDLSKEEMLSNAKKAYAEAMKAQKAGDWAGYGKYMSELETYLNKL